MDKPKSKTIYKFILVSLRTTRGVKKKNKTPIVILIFKVEL